MLFLRFHPETMKNPVHPVDPVKKNIEYESIPYQNFPARKACR
jgi:hypothetical protein